MEVRNKHNRRLRKKLYLGEFAVNLFEIHVKLSTSKESDLDAFIASFVDQLEKQGLTYFGYSDPDGIQGHVLSQQRYESPTESQRQALSEWCGTYPTIESYELGELVDINQA
ncbi:50S ribosome-binding protein YggL [Amphritea sp.]|uniref:50S ribosome-binding protein YggL n=1 Tax=Amphritea sp. TaxID=1872502 RepID=UPI003A8F8036